MSQSDEIVDFNGDWVSRVRLYGAVSASTVLAGTVSVSTVSVSTVPNDIAPTAQCPMTQLVISIAVQTSLVKQREVVT